MIRRIWGPEQGSSEPFLLLYNIFVLLAREGSVVILKYFGIFAIGLVFGFYNIFLNNMQV